MHLKLGVLASGRGSNLQAIIDACKSGALEAEVRLVLSNNPESGALRKASTERIPALRLSSRTHPDPADLDRAIRGALQDHGVEWVVLAGYMKKLGPQTLSAFRGRVLNIHPALLPKFGGPGMYGRRVHEAVLEAREPRTGVSVHLVDEEYDHGEILAQTEVEVQRGDTADSLAERVLQHEHELLVNTLRRISGGELVLP